MMMQYRHRNRETHKTLPMVLAIGFFVVFFGIDFLVGNTLTGGIRTVLAPAVASVRTALVPQSISQYLTDRSALLDENKRLKENQSALEGRLSVALARITDLELQFGSGISSTQLKKISHIARVISYAQYPFGELTILFPSGASTVKENTFVYTNEGAVVGTILSTDGSTALVGLLSKSGEKYTMRIGEETIADVYGKGGVTLFADVPKNAPISVGDIVTLPEAEGAPVGVVGEITTSETDIVQHVLIRLVANPVSLSFVTAYE